jgi:hypothetical protein
VIRLVRINLYSQEHEVIWEGSASWNYGTHWLTVDSDGQVLLTSSSWWAGYTTMRIEADPYELGTAVATAQQFGSDPLVAAPVVDADGYWFVTVDDQNQFQSTRVQVLAPPSPSGISIGDCF